MNTDYGKKRRAKQTAYRQSIISDEEGEQLCKDITAVGRGMFEAMSYDFIKDPCYFKGKRGRKR